MCGEERARENVSKCEQLLNPGGGFRSGHSACSLNFCICLRSLWQKKKSGKLSISKVLCSTFSRTWLLPLKVFIFFCLAVRDRVRSKMERDILAEVNHPFIVKLHYGLCVLSHVRLFATPWSVAHPAPLSIGFSRKEYWSGLPFPTPGDLPNPGMEPRSPTLRADSSPAEPPGKPCVSKTPTL